LELVWARISSTVSSGDTPPSTDRGKHPSRQIGRK
jgi:hypothetical protein